MEFNGIKKILVIKLRHIGDVLLTVPVFRALRETFPEARVSALVNYGTEEVLEGNPLIDEVLVYDRRIKRLPLFQHYKREIEFVREVRRKRFDMTVDLTGGDRGAIISFLSGARVRIGWLDRKGWIWKRYFYTYLFHPEAKRHTVLKNLDIVRSLGIDTKDITVDFCISEDDRNFIKEILSKKGVRGFPVVHIHPTSRWLFKCWNDASMAEVIKWLLEKGATVILTSSPEKKEMEKAANIVSRVGKHHRFIDLCGKITLKELAAISEVSDLFLGIDSAPMHIAAAMGTPVIALFGPTGAFNWGPWNNQKTDYKTTPYPARGGIQKAGLHTVVQRDWECVPCGKDGCEGSKVSRCIEDIDPQEIINIIEEQLSPLHHRWR